MAYLVIEFVNEKWAKVVAVCASSDVAWAIAEGLGKRATVEEWPMLYDAQDYERD